MDPEKLRALMDNWEKRAGELQLGGAESAARVLYRCAAELRELVDLGLLPGE
jgi:hypothetical protein